MQCYLKNNNKLYYLGYTINKCDKYWPDKCGKSETFGNMEITMTCEEDFVANEVILRRLEVKSKYFPHTYTLGCYVLNIYVCSF